ARRAARRSRCGSTTCRGSLVELSPALRMPDRVKYDAVARAAPEAMAAARLRLSRAAPMPPAMARRLAQRSFVAGLPVSRGSASAGCMGSVSFSAKYRSAADPRAAKIRAGRFCVVGVVMSATPEDAMAAEETNRYDKLSLLAFHVGTAVSASKAPV